MGEGGKQALGGRPEADGDATAAPIVLNAVTLRAHFNLPLNDAAKVGRGTERGGGGGGRGEVKQERRARALHTHTSHP